MDAADWLRATLSISSLIISGWLLVMTVRVFRNLSYGQRLWATGAVCVLIYVADGLREAIQTDLEFRWRLLPLIFGLIAYFAYLLEPRTRRHQRLGKGRDPLAPSGG